MFTSRAEFRILLRQDNADQRLTPLSYAIGLASEERMRRVEKKTQSCEELISFIEKNSALPEEVNNLFEEKETPIINQKTKIGQLILRPQINLKDLSANIPYLKEKVDLIDQSIKEEVVESAEIKIKYQSYIDKEQEISDKLSKHENLIIKDDFNYQALNSLSFEAREKLTKIRPKTIGQASRISGVSPSDISVLIIYISK
jgi:tRNA uridine 5-carboxymethylaminomethyl modification enzyme